jgi:plasmid stabilization system protein ParE
MTKPWRVTQQAEQSLLDIALWTVETFGPRQADAYEQDILAKLDDIAAGVAHTQSCRVLIDSNLADDIRFTRVGGHYLIYIEYPDSFVLQDLLHQRVDLTQHLARVSPPQRS